MVLRFVDSFDHYATADVATKWNSSAGAGITANGRNGTSCMETVGGTSNNFWSKTLDSQATWIVGAAIRWPTLLQAGWLFFIDGSTTHVFLQFDASGHIQATRNGTVLGTGTIVLLPNIYYYIECKVTINDTTGVVVVKINGVTDINLSSQDTRNGGNSTADKVQFFGTGSTGGAFRIDDLYICDGTGSSPTNDFLGDCRVQALFPNNNGNSSQWTNDAGNSTNNYSHVNETTPNGDTSYVEDSTVGDKDTYAFGDLTPTAGTVYGVQPCLYARKTDAGTRSIVSIARVSSTEVDSAASALVTSYLYYLDIRETKPGGGTWSISDVNSAEFGVKVTA